MRRDIVDYALLRKMCVRFTISQKKKILSIWKKNQDIWDSPSHWVRSATIRAIRSYEEKELKEKILKQKRKR